MALAPDFLLHDDLKFSAVSPILKESYLISQYGDISTNSLRYTKESQLHTWKRE